MLRHIQRCTEEEAGKVLQTGDSLFLKLWLVTDLLNNEISAV